jgi:hypothetical protein
VLTPPTGVPNDVLGHVIERGWGIDVVSLEYLPLGFGSHHWLAAGNLGVRYFVTVDELNPQSRAGDEVSVLGLSLRRALTAATDLRGIGCDFVVAPIPTGSGDPLVGLDGHAVALYPYIEGQRFRFEMQFTEAQRHDILELVAALHLVPVTAIRAPAADDFIVPWLNQLDLSGQDSHERSAIGPYAAVTSGLLIEHEAEIRRLRRRYRALLTRSITEPGPGPGVVTHGEIHPGNAMRTSTGWAIVDWDTVLVAPPERDLWWLAKRDASVLRHYEEMATRTPDPQLIELYGLRWDLTEIASFAQELRQPHDDTEDSRKALACLQAVVRGLKT